MKYYILVGIDKRSDTKELEYIFGDYDKQVCIEEKESLASEYKKLNVIRLDSDQQQSIANKMNELNN